MCGCDGCDVCGYDGCGVCVDVMGVVCVCVCGCDGCGVCAIHTWGCSRPDAVQ